MLQRLPEGKVGSVMRFQASNKCMIQRIAFLLLLPTLSFAMILPDTIGQWQRDVQRSQQQHTSLRMRAARIGGDRRHAGNRGGLIRQEQ